MSAPTWDLESIYPGGPESKAFYAHMEELEERAGDAIARADSLGSIHADPTGWASTILAIAELGWEAKQVEVFAGCHSSADATSTPALLARSRAAALHNAIERAWVPIHSGVAVCEEDVFADFMRREDLVECAPRLRCIRRDRANLMPTPQAGLVVELAKDGIHAWSRLYSRVSGTLQVSLDDGRELSASQAQNLLASPDAVERKSALQALNAGWTEVAETCASALTHIVGTRLTLNRRRGVGTLSDTLARSRMSQSSLDAMLEAGRRAVPILQKYLAAKARHLGKEKLAWEDQSAPLGDLGSTDWREATSFIEQHFRSWNPVLGDYAATAFRERWIEAEDRPNKRPGGWCAGLPSPPGSSRIFMTFGDNFRSTTTLAHELGHGYHNFVLRDVPPARNHVPSTLAETASVFAENIVRDAALAAARTDTKRLAMLDARLSAGIGMLMNIPFRYNLELALYEMRERGELQVAELNERTQALQREAYADSLSSWYPLFWAEKLHFYISDFAFYNYPYMFGYLFSTLVYRHAKREGPSFLPRYDDLLRRTAWEDAEPLARDVLGIDLTDPDDWYQGVAPLEEDLEAFLALT